MRIGITLEFVNSRIAVFVFQLPLLVYR